MNQRHVDIPVSSDRRKSRTKELFRNALSGLAQAQLAGNMFAPSPDMTPKAPTDPFVEDEEAYLGGLMPPVSQPPPTAMAAPVTQPGEIGLTAQQFETMAAGHMPSELKDLSPDTIFKQTAQGVHPGYGLAATGGTGPVKPLLEGMAYGLMQTADILFEPLDVATETAAELTGETAKKGFALAMPNVNYDFQRPTLFSEGSIMAGYEKSRDDFRARGILAQMGLSVVYDPFILTKVLRIPITATRVGARDLIRVQVAQASSGMGHSARDIDNATDALMSRIGPGVGDTSASAIRLPRDLAGAKPRYRDHTLTFESDIDRALYILAQRQKSKRDADYLSFVMEMTGMDEAAARSAGGRVREAIRDRAGKAAEGDALTLPDTKLGFAGRRTEAAALLAQDPAAAVLSDPATRMGIPGVRAGRYVSHEKIAGGQPLKVGDDSDPAKLIVETPDGSRLSIGRGIVEEIPEAAPTAAREVAAPTVQAIRGSTQALRASNRTVDSYMKSKAAKFFLAGNDLLGNPTKINVLSSKKMSDLTVDDINDLLVEGLGSVGSTSPGIQRAADNLVNALVAEAESRGLSQVPTEQLARGIDIRFAEPAHPYLGGALEAQQRQRVAAAPDPAPVVTLFEEGVDSPMVTSAKAQRDKRQADIQASLTPKEQAEQIARRHNMRESLSGTGGPPTPPTRPTAVGAASAGDPGRYIPGQLDRVDNSWSKSVASGIKSTLRHPMKSLEKAYDNFQLNWTDRLVYINKMTTRAKQQFRREMGFEMPASMNAELASHLLGGFPKAGVEIYLAMHEGMTRALGRWPIMATLRRVRPEDQVNRFLRLKHAETIMQIPEFAGRKLAGGIEGLDGVRSALSDMSDQLGPELMNRVAAASKIYVDTLNEMLDRKVRAGLVNPELATHLKEKWPWYNPIRYMETELTPYFDKGLGRSMSVTNNDLRRLGEIGLELDQVKPMDVAARHIVTSEMMIRRNNAGTAILASALFDPSMSPLIVREMVEEVPGAATTVVSPIRGKVPPGEKAGTISVFRNGKREVWRVPPEIEQAAKGMSSFDINPLERMADVVNSLPRAFLTANNPAFMSVNLAFDTVIAAFTRGVMPWETFTSLLATLKDLVARDETLRQMFLSGGDVSGLAGRSQQQLIRDVTKGSQLAVVNRRGFKRLLNPLNVWDTLGRVSYAMELTPRRAIFKKQIKKGLSPEEAALQARRVTVDWNRAGAAARIANHYFMYLNAGIQGTLLPMRAVRDYPAARYGLAGIATWTAALYAWNRQFPEYYDVREFDRYGTGIIMTPSNEYDKYGKKVPHYWTVPPVLREITALTAPETYILGKLDERMGYRPAGPMFEEGGRPESEEFDWGAGIGTMLDGMVPKINPLGMVAEIGGSGLESITVPTYFGDTVAQMVRNRDTFRDEPIVPMELQGLPAKDQYDERSSDAAKLLGEVFDWSPKMIDFAMRFGVAKDLMSAASVAVRYMRPDQVDPRIDALAAQLEDIQERYPQDQIAIQRKKFLQALSPEDEKEVLKAERKPDPTIPFVTTIVNRWHRKHGGSIHRQGQREAAKETKTSAEQTKLAGRARARFGENIEGLRKDAERKVNDGIWDLADWRADRRIQGGLWKGHMLALSLEFPSAAQVDPKVWSEYKEYLYTLGGAMENRQTKGQVLADGWYSITPIEDPVTGFPDMDTFFAQREDYRDGLSEEDRKDMDEWRNAGMDSIAIQWEEDLERLRDYWDGTVEEALSHQPPDHIAIYERWKLGNTSEKERMEMETFSTSAGPNVMGADIINVIKEDIAFFRENYRNDNRWAGALLIKWWPTYTPQNEDEQRAKEAQLDKSRPEDAQVAPSIVPAQPARLPPVREGSQSQGDASEYEQRLKEAFGRRRSSPVGVGP